MQKLLVKIPGINNLMTLFGVFSYFGVSSCPCHATVGATCPVIGIGLIVSVFFAKIWKFSKGIFLKPFRYIKTQISRQTI